MKDSMVRLAIQDELGFRGDVYDEDLEKIMDIYNDYMFHHTDFLDGKGLIESTSWRHEMYPTRILNSHIRLTKKGWDNFLKRNPTKKAYNSAIKHYKLRWNGAKKEFKEAYWKLDTVYEDNIIKTMKADTIEEKMAKVELLREYIKTVDVCLGKIYDSYESRDVWWDYHKVHSRRIRQIMNSKYPSGVNHEK